MNVVLIQIQLKIRKTANWQTNWVESVSRLLDCRPLLSWHIGIINMLVSVAMAKLEWCQHAPDMIQSTPPAKAH